ncbi:MAG: RsmE family RNA methyltransferase, partial [Thermoleophilia bacterium]|nr:RsmE family RNA methyltransferase [Thermoleophilia bacterium]
MQEVALSPDDCHHARTVLRLRPGDRCEVVLVPSREVYAGELLAGERPVRVRLLSRLEGVDAGASYRYAIGIVQALARPAALDYVVEKGTEVGVSFFIFFPAAGSLSFGAQPGEGRLRRWCRLAQEAAKQSKQTAVPSVQIAKSLDEALALIGRRGARSLVLEPSASCQLGEALSAACGGAESNPGEPSPANSGLSQSGSAEFADLALWVGPEGGWEIEELQRLEQAGARLARLGKGV